MAIKRIIGKGNNRKYKTCLRCGQAIEGVLHDDTVYTCERCGQQHYVDVYRDSITLTVAERPEIRHRRTEVRYTRQAAARRALIEKVEKKKVAGALEAWADNLPGFLRDKTNWLEELAALPPDQLQKEYSYMGEEMRLGVERALMLREEFYRVMGPIIEDVKKNIESENSE